MKKTIKKKINKAMAKRAVGYEAEEIVEEYDEDDGIMRLKKKRVTRKHYPPDTQAAKILLEGLKDDELSVMTEEELEAEKQRLLKYVK